MFGLNRVLVFGKEEVYVRREGTWREEEVLYIACPARPRVDMIIMAQAFLRAGALDMGCFLGCFWLVSHMW